MLRFVWIFIIILAEYRQLRKTLTAMGFNGAMLDVKLPVLSNDVNPEG
jgi:hypothetical protein